MQPAIVAQRELLAGDMVDIGGGGYSCATVTKIIDGIIHLVRPYVHFDHETGIDYIGIESWTMFQDSNRTITRMK